MYVCMYVPTYICNILCGSGLCMYLYTHACIILSGHVLRTYVCMYVLYRVDVCCVCTHSRIIRTKWKRAMYVRMYVCTYVY